MLQEFLGVVNLSHHFIPCCADMNPLHGLLKGLMNACGPLKWTPAADNMPSLLSSRKTENILLAHPATEALTSLSMDAASATIGAVLYLFINDR